VAFESNVTFIYIVMVIDLYIVFLCFIVNLESLRNCLSTGVIYLSNPLRITTCGLYIIGESIISIYGIN
jgi:hypothetical protein